MHFQFFRNISAKSSLLVRAVALATAGSGILCFISSDCNTSLSISIPSAFSDPPMCRTMLMNFNSTYDHSNRLKSDICPLFFSGSDALPVPDVIKVAAMDAEYCLKHSCDCFERNTIANAAAKIAPAVVHLSAPAGVYGVTTGRCSGSGTIINEDGTILTCSHVVAHALSLKSSSKGKIEVTLKDGRSFEGKVVNADFQSDVAIVKIKSETPLPAAKLGHSSKLHQGEWVIAMGAPHSLQNTLTAGIISCVDRKSSDLGLGGVQMEYLQTDSAINQGSSGGPLVNTDGEVVGVNMMKLRGADGMSFSIPIDSVSKIMEEFQKNGRVIRPWLGMKMVDQNQMAKARLRRRSISIPHVINRGIFIRKVLPGSPAALAGICPGDILVEFGGQPVGSTKEVLEIMADGIGKPFKVVVKRASNVHLTSTVIPVDVNPEI